MTLNWKTYPCVWGNRKATFQTARTPDGRQYWALWDSAQRHYYITIQHKNTKKHIAPFDTLNEAKVYAEKLENERSQQKC